MFDPETTVSMNHPEEINLHNVTISCIMGDISAQTDITAVVNAANEWLQPGGGVAGAIHRAAGPGLAEECRPLAPIKPGEAILTSGHNLPNSYVIHCLGPVYGADKPEDKLLADCYRNALSIADEHQINSIAFPAISSGAFCYPLIPATEVALHTIKKIIPFLQHVRLIRFVLYSREDFEIYLKMMKQIL